MAFFALQSEARRAARRLCVLCFVALFAVSCALAFGAQALWRLLAVEAEAAPWLFAGSALLMALLTIGGVYEQLRRGQLRREGAEGCSILRRLAASGLDESNPRHRCLRDVAEEAAVGAGVPVPALFVVDGLAINAMAVGERPSRAAVVLTRAAIEQLDCRQLRVVVAHQIAMIAGGQAALNQRLAGALYGLGLLGRIGEALLVPAARLMQAALGHRRTWLADEMAVRITGDRDALAAVLHRACVDRDPARDGEGPRDGLRTPSPLPLEHLLFLPPACGGPRSASRTALARRILRLYGRPLSGSASGGGVSPVTTALAESPAAILLTVLRSGPPSHERSACWLCTLVTGKPGPEAAPEPDSRVAAALRWLLSPEGALLRVPVLELLLARLRGWSSAQRRDALERCQRLLQQDTDGKAGWVRYTLARHRLLPGRDRLRPGGEAESLTPSRALAALFAMAASVGEASARTTRDTLAETAALIDVPPPAATPDELDSGELGSALDTLTWLPCLDKPILLRMLARMARTPGDLDFQAFLRAVAAAIDCPMPWAYPDSRPLSKTL